MRVRAGNSIVSSTNGSLFFEAAWVRSAGNVFGDECYNILGSANAWAALATYYNAAGKSTDFIFQWAADSGTASGYALATSTGSAPSFSSPQPPASHVADQPMPLNYQFPLLRHSTTTRLAA